MNRDIRKTALYLEAEALYLELRQPGTGLISDAAEVSTNGAQAVFTGSLLNALSGVPTTRICLTDLATGDTRVMTYGPNTDRAPQFSPDGRAIAFLSDRRKPGDFQLHLLDPVSGAARPTASVNGWVEYLRWSPDGKEILLGVAGHGADVAGGQGAVASKGVATDLPTWLPAVQTGVESHLWRSVWVYNLDTGRAHQVSHAEVNVWEAAWCGADSVAAVVSSGPGEGLWYSASLHLLDAQTGNSREVYKPGDQVGLPAGSPSGKHLAIVEAVCSDRWVVAGNLRLIETDSGKIQPIDTRGVDITYTEWRSDRHLLLAGQRRFASVVGLYDVASRTFSEVWSSEDIFTGGFYITVSGFNETGDFVLVGESSVRAPEIAWVRRGQYQPVKSFDLGYAENAKVIEGVDRLSWKAPDGLEIDGWLLRPKGKGPHPVVMFVHGGPVAQWHPTWIGRRSVHLLMLIKRGYAVFFPNPRGSAGRGQDFARQVFGDAGGADTFDFLSGLDYLVDRGIADPKRLGVTGGSYGGFMTSWLITQDTRFAAAISASPVTNWVTEQLTSNIPHFVAMFLRDTYTNRDGKHFQRSPLLHAHKVKTPTLNICGALDRCTPPAEAVQFHNALRENHVESVLLIYPEEGHGIRKFPAAIDYGARLVAWFEQYLGAGSTPVA